MAATHLLIETGHASRVTICDEPFSNGQPGTEDITAVTCVYCLALLNAPEEPSQAILDAQTMLGQGF